MTIKEYLIENASKYNDKNSLVVACMNDLSFSKRSINNIFHDNKIGDKLNYTDHKTPIINTDVKYINNDIPKAITKGIKITDLREKYSLPTVIKKYIASLSEEEVIDENK